MRSPLLNQLRALERKRDEIVSQIGGQTQVESQPLKESRDRWRNVQVTHLDTELDRLRGSPNKLHSHSHGVFRNSATADALLQEKIIESAIKEQQKREAIHSTTRARRGAKLTRDIGHLRAKSGTPNKSSLYLSPYLDENARIGDMHVRKPRPESASPTGTFRSGSHKRSEDPKDLIHKATLALDHREFKARAECPTTQRVAGRSQQHADKALRLDNTKYSLKAATAPLTALHGKANSKEKVIKHPDRGQPHSLDELEERIVHHRLQKSLVKEVSSGIRMPERDLTFLKLLSGEIPHPAHPCYNLHTFPLEEPETITSPRSLDLICRRGLGPDDLRLFPVEHYIAKCGGNEEAGRIWFDQSEKMRKSLLRRLRKERRKLVGHENGRGNHDKAEHDSGSRTTSRPHSPEKDGGVLSPVASQPQSAEDGVMSQQHSHDADESGDLGHGGAASAISKPARTPIPHFGAVLETTKASLRSIADKERALNERLAKAERRRIDNRLGEMLEHKNLMEDVQDNLRRKRQEREKLMHEKQLKASEQQQERKKAHKDRHNAMMQQRTQLVQQQRDEVQEKLLNADQNVERLAMQRRDAQEKRNLLFQIKRATAARRMDFSARVCMYNNQKTLKSIWQAEERQDLIESAQRIVQQERKDQKAYLAHEKRVTHDLIDEFNRTGKFDKSLHMYASEGRLPKSLQHLVRVSKNIPVTIGDMEQQDGLSKNREATSLLKNTSVEGRVESGKYVYYKILVKNPRVSIKIHLKGKTGDPDLVVGNSSCPVPTIQNATWKKTGFGDDKIRINYFDENFELGWIYIGVYGAGRLLSEFNLNTHFREKQDETGRKSRTSLNSAQQTVPGPDS